MKTVYFVRHGESEGNAASVSQTADSPLTKTGLDQAKLIAKRCAKLPIDVVISSNMKRATQTAEIIAKKVKKTHETYNLFMERKRPSEQVGRHTSDPELIRIQQTVFNNFLAGSGARFSDEETFDDIKVRAGNALKFLESRKEDNILVVTHGLFLRMMIAHVLFGDKLSPHECLRFIEKTVTKNTGITVITDDSKKYHEDSPWRLEVWNDHAHLG